MKASARAAAAIEIVRTVLDGAAADRAIVSWGRTHRFAGSGDRRAVADFVYAALRAVPTGDARRQVLAGLKGQGLGPEAIDALFDGTQHAPEPLSETERALLAETPKTPQWLSQALQRVFAGAAEFELAALNQRAPLDLRVNTLKMTRAAAIERLAEDGIVAEPVAAAPTALRVQGRADIEQSAAYALGLVEIQDAGSQIVTALVDARPGDVVLDLCAGAGGKTLGLAAAMQNTGRILSCDIAAVRLKRIAPRLTRAGVTIARTKLLLPDWLADPAPFTEPFDRIVIDAPCSGSGTWRRNPETRARLTPEAVANLAALQLKLLAKAAPFLKPGGQLTYITCSLFAEEGEDVVAAFLDAHPHFALVGSPTRLSPASTGTDGFFAAILVCRPSA